MADDVTVAPFRWASASASAWWAHGGLLPTWLSLWLNSQPKHPPMTQGGPLSKHSAEQWLVGTPLLWLKRNHTQKRALKLLSENEGVRNGRNQLMVLNQADSTKFQQLPSLRCFSSVRGGGWCVCVLISTTLLFISLLSPFRQPFTSKQSYYCLYYNQEKILNAVKLLDHIFNSFPTESVIYLQLESGAHVQKHERAPNQMFWGCYVDKLKRILTEYSLPLHVTYILI